MLLLQQPITTSDYNNQNDIVFVSQNDVVLSKKISNWIFPQIQRPVVVFPSSLASRRKPEREEENQTPASQASSSVATTLGVAPAVEAKLSRVRWICLATPSPRWVPR